MAPFSSPWALLGCVSLLFVIFLGCFVDSTVIPQPRFGSAEVSMPTGPETGSKASSNDDSDNYDDYFDHPYDGSYESSSEEASSEESSSEAPSKPAPEKPAKLLRLCTSLTPTHASTRNGPFIRFECSARICTDSGADSPSSYSFRTPFFDWNSQFSHMLLSNGTCDGAGTKCWHTIEINVDSLVDAMEEDAIEQLEITCSVADYVKSYDVFNYAFGGSTSILKHFKGNKAHESCNTTLECGENLVCTPKVDNSILEDDISAGFCECPVYGSSGVASNASTAFSRQYILVKDAQFLEEVCVPLRTFNQSCRYSEQCKGTDGYLTCQQVVRPEDGLQSSEMVCNCTEGFKWSLDSGSMKCTVDWQQFEVDYDKADSPKDPTEAGRIDSDVKISARNESRNFSDDADDEKIIIWWIIPPTDFPDFQHDTTSRHGLFYYGSRYLTLTGFAYALMTVAVLLPLLIFIITMTVYCHRRLHQARQYSHRRTSFSESVFYPESMPSTPSEKNKSTITFGFGGETPPSSPKASGKKVLGQFSLISKKPEDKLGLVGHDQLEETH